MYYLSIGTKFSGTQLQYSSTHTSKISAKWRPKLRGGHVEAIIIGAKCAPRGGQNESHDGSNVTQDRPSGHDWFVWSIPIGKVTHRRFP